MWLQIKKNKARKSKTQQQREAEFRQKLDLLFDFAHADALSKFGIKEDSDFLVDQPTARKMFITETDMELVKKQEKADV